MHAYISEYPAGPVRSHETGECELNTQLFLPLNPLEEDAQVLAVLAALSCCMIDIANSSLFPESMQDAGRRKTIMRDSSV